MRSKRLIWMLAISAGLVAVGTLGYYVLEREYTLFDALYMTVTTLTTVGYGETHPLHIRGRVFTIFLLLGGVLTFSFLHDHGNCALDHQRRNAGTHREATHGTQFGNLAESRHHLRLRSHGPFRLSGVLAARSALRHHRPRRRLVTRFRHGGRDRLARRCDLGRVAQESRRRARSSAYHRHGKRFGQSLYHDERPAAERQTVHCFARRRRAGRAETLARRGQSSGVTLYIERRQDGPQAVLQPNVVDFLELATQTEHLDLQIEETVVDEGAAAWLRQTLRRFPFAARNSASSSWPSKRLAGICFPIPKATP